NALGWSRLVCLPITRCNRVQFPKLAKANTMSLVPSTILNKIDDAAVREELANGKHADGSPIRSYADLTAPQVRAINIATYGPEDSPRKSVTMPGGNISVEIGWFTLQELA